MHIQRPKPNYSFSDINAMIAEGGPTADLAFEHLIRLCRPNAERSFRREPYSKFVQIDFWEKFCDALSALELRLQKTDKPPIKNHCNYLWGAIHKMCMRHRERLIVQEEINDASLPTEMVAEMDMKWDEIKVIFEMGWDKLNFSYSENSVVMQKFSKLAEACKKLLISRYVFDMSYEMLARRVNKAEHVVKHELKRCGDRWLGAIPKEMRPRSN